MQKLYLTKCLVIVLSVISASISGMNVQCNNKQLSQKINNKIITMPQTVATKKIPKDYYDTIEAAQQECDILWYTQVTAEKKYTDAKKLLDRKKNA
jgi:hypothetical protein